LSFDRRWLEDAGSEDSHGRAVWALGECSRSDLSPSRRRWASSLFRDSLRAVEDFSSPRAWAFALLGLEAYCDVTRSDEAAKRSRRVLSERLMSILRSVETPDWVWFETGLAYDNARLSQALIVTGMATGELDQVEAGLRTLRWLMTLLRELAKLIPLPAPYSPHEAAQLNFASPAAAAGANSATGTRGFSTVSVVSGSCAQMPFIP
jgi:hypothetical protein